jgi:hypothetical protein
MMRLHQILITKIRSAARHKPAWTPSIVSALARNTAQHLHHWYHVRAAKHAISGRVANLDDLSGLLSECLIPIRAPLVLISQVQRSGGTLLSQLFDAHSAIAAYPHELRLGYADADRWQRPVPGLGCDANFHMLFDLQSPRYAPRGLAGGEGTTVRHPFLLISRVQFELFRSLFETRPPTSEREVFDHFFTAFFNAWLNYQGDLEKKRWITAFAPRLAHEEANLAAFFECYPDGLLVQIIRDPETWYPSARNHRASAWADSSSQHIVDKWIASARSVLRNKKRYGARVIVLRFEDLVGRTEQTMRRLSDELGVGFEPVLLQPSFNGRLMRANSSFAVQGPGVINAPLERAASLTVDEREMIRARCLAIYQQVAADALALPVRTPK